MAKAAKTAWGIDVGNCALKAIKLNVGSEGVEVLDFAVIEHEKILSQPDMDAAQRQEQITNALQKFLDEYDISKSAIVVSVPGQSSFARFIKLPPVESKRIPELVRFEAMQQIPFDINDVEWDWQLFQTKESPEIEVGIFAIKRDLVHKSLDPFLNINCSIGLVQMAPMALYNFLHFDQKQLREQANRQAVIALDIGAENTDLVIADGTRVWQRSIAIGGNHFTAAVQKAFKLSFAKAESIKRTASTSKYARQIFQAMRSVFADLAAEVQRSLGFYSSSNRNVQFREVLALGNAMKLPGLVKFLQQSLSLPVKRVDTFESLLLGPDISRARLAENLPSLAVAYGLALQGVGLGTITSNLLPREIARRGQWQRKRRWFLAASAVFFIAALLYVFQAYSQSSEIASLQGDLNQIDSKVRDINTRGSERNKFRGEISSAIKKIDDRLKTYETPGILPQLMQAVRVCLPNQINASSPEQAALYQAFQNADRETVLQLPRDQREQVFVSGVQIIYAPDLHLPFEQIISQSVTDTKRKKTSTTPGMMGPGMMGPGMMGPGMMGPGMMGPGMMDPGMGGPGMMGPGMGGPAAPKSSKGKSPQGPQIEDKDKASGFVVIIEGITPHHDARQFLSPIVSELERDQWGFFQRLRYLGKTNAEIKAARLAEKEKDVKKKPDNKSPFGATSAMGPKAPAAAEPETPLTEAEQFAAALPFATYEYPGEILGLYFDDTEGGAVTYNGADQPEGIGIPKPQEQTTTSARTGAAEPALDILLDPFTMEPVSETFVRGEQNQILYDEKGNPIKKKNDHWFRIKFKVQLKEDAKNAKVAKGTKKSNDRDD